MRAFLVPVLLLIAWLAGTPAAQAHELPCPPGAMKTAMPVGHGHYPIAPVTADAETGVVLVEDEESRLGDLPIELPLPAAHGCCHVVVSFLPAAEPAAAPSFIPELPRPLRSALPEAGLLVFGIYRPPLFS